MKTFKTISFLLVGIVGLVVLNTCGKELQRSSPPAPRVSKSFLETAQDTAVIDDIAYHAAIFPWRDFMPGPGMPENGKGLMVVAKLCRADSLEIGEEIRLKFVWVVYGNQIWGAELEDERRAYEVEHCRQGVSYGGPKWGPFVEVYAVIGFVLESGELMILRTPPEIIVRTD